MISKHISYIALMGTVAAGALNVPAVSWAQAQGAQAAAAEEEVSLPDVIVTARRTEEKLQDVPVAVSVLTAETIESQGVFNPVDIAKNATGLSVVANVSNRNNLAYTIRGQGRSFGTVFPAVITYYNEVPIAQLTEGQFFDLANVQVLRGPQGVSFGRVTDGGNVMITPQLPKGSFGGYVGGKVGDYGLRNVNGALNVPIAEDKLLARIAFDVTRRDGFTLNVLNGQKLDNVKYESFRGSLTARPTESLENTLTISYQNTNDNGTSAIFAVFNPAATQLLPRVGQLAFLFGAGAGFGVGAPGYGIDANGSVVPFQPGVTEPFTAENYAASLGKQLAEQEARGPRAVSWADPSFSKRKNLYITNTTTVNLSDAVEMKNIFGYVRERDSSSVNFAGPNGAVVVRCSVKCLGNALPNKDSKQVSNELRFSGKLFNDSLSWSLGGYIDKQSPAGPSEETSTSLGVIQRININYLTTTSKAIYSAVEYAVTDNIKLNGGVRYTKDTVKSEINTYQRPLDGGQEALFNTLTSPAAAFIPGLGGPLPPDIANGIVAATFAPFPSGKCETYGAGSLLYADNITADNPTGEVPCVTRNGSFTATTWSFGASYQTGGGQLFYAKIGKGYRPGGVNFSAPVGVDPSYRPETNISIEAGVKADFKLAGMALRTNLALFTDRYKAIQKLLVLPGAVPVSLISNVNDARIKGVEAEATIIPFKGLQIGGNLAYTDAKFDKKTPPAVNNPCDPTSSFTDGFCSDNLFTSTPKWQWTLNANYELPLPESFGQLSFGVQAFHQGRMALFDTSVLNPETVEPGKTTLDANVDWNNIGGRPVDLGFFITNLTNKTYRIASDSLSHNASLGTSSSIYAPPRMWGFSLKYRFGGEAD